MPRAMRRERGKTRVVHVSTRSLDVNVVDAAERAGERANKRASERASGDRGRGRERFHGLPAYPRIPDSRGSHRRTLIARYLG